MWRATLELSIDVALTASTTHYAEWLDAHKELEPDWTWVEVAIGVAICMLHATAHGAIRRGDWRTQQARVVRSLVLGAVPVVVGEMRQYRRRRIERRRYQARRHE